METELKAAMTARVLVEFFDAAGHCIGQSVFADWHGRPLPAAGDLLNCEVNCTASVRKRKLLGRVRARHFDVQRTDDDSPSVWARLTVDAVDAAEAVRPDADSRRRADFVSRN